MQEIDWAALENATGWAGLVQAAQESAPANERGHAAGRTTSTPAAPSTRQAEELRPTSPLIAPLPKAPSFKVFCMYGVGIATERGYHYVNIDHPDGSQSWRINTLISDASIGLDKGVQNVDGDGTVPTLSLGECSIATTGPVLTGHSCACV